MTAGINPAARDRVIRDGIAISTAVIAGMASWQLALRLAALADKSFRGAAEFRSREGVGGFGLAFDTAM